MTTTGFKPRFTLKTVKHGGIAGVTIWGCFPYYSSHTRVRGSVCLYWSTWRSHVTLGRRGNVLIFVLLWTRQRPVSDRHLDSKTNQIKGSLEWPQPNAQTLIPIESSWGDIKKCCSWGKTRKCRGVVECRQIILGWNDLFTGARSRSIPCKTDVKQFSETMVIQLNISLVIHRNAKSWRFFSLYSEYFSL